jgi:hypothetical protein
MSAILQLLNATDLGETVVGCYLWPFVLLAGIEDEDPWSLTRIVWTLTVNHHKVFLTANGGLFTAPPVAVPPGDVVVSISTDPVRQEAAAKITELLNLCVCEFALTGIVSEPVSPATLAGSRMTEGYIVIKGSSPGNFYRTGQMIRQLQEEGLDTWKEWEQREVALRGLMSLPLVEDVLTLTRANCLANIAPATPALVAGAYFMYSRRSYTEAVVNAWMVIEQVLHSAWRTYLGTLESTRRQRLSDHRTYSAAVKVEVMLTAGVLEETVYEAINAARKIRNGLLHAAQRLSFDQAHQVHQALEIILNSVLSAPLKEFRAWPTTDW